MARPRPPVLAAVVLLVAATATAQPRRGTPQPTRLTIAVSGGVQGAAPATSDQFSFERNIETETIDVTYPMKATTLVDVGAGYRLWKSLGVGVAVSRATGTGTAQVTARVPHPFFFNQPRTITGTENGIVHAETGLHFQLRYLVPSRGRLRAVLAAGPSWTTLEHEAVTNVTVAESYPFDTAAFGGAVTTLPRASAAGFNAGVDLTWMFARGAGIGGLVRYTRADVDLDVGGGRRLAMQAGGVQGGLGIRIGF